MSNAFRTRATSSAALRTPQQRAHPLAASKKTARLSKTFIVERVLTKRLRRTIDELSHLHKLPSLEQKQPGFAHVRVYVPDSDPVVVDLDTIRQDLTTLRKDQDVVFDLRIVVVAADGGAARAFLIPCGEVEGVSQISRVLTNLARYEVSLPDDVDVPTTARAMGLIA
jgi:hypothetical protein